MSFFAGRSFLDHFMCLVGIQMRLCIYKCYGKRKVSSLKINPPPPLPHNKFSPGKLPLGKFPSIYCLSEDCPWDDRFLDDCVRKMSPPRRLPLGKLNPGKFHIKNYHLKNSPIEDCSGMFAP